MKFFNLSIYEEWWKLVLTLTHWHSLTGLLQKWQGQLLDQISYPNLLRSCACAESDRAVEDPLINLIISLCALILGWKYSARDHIFN